MDLGHHCGTNSRMTSSLVDISRLDQIAACLAERADGSRVDIFVNDAGYLGLTHSFEHHPLDDWRRIVEVNLLGTMQVTQAVLP